MVRVDNISGWEVNQKVLLIQMKGASINASNNSNYGQVDDLGFSGQYEISEIQSIDGDEITLKTDILNLYDLSWLQLVSIPTYQNAVVVDTLKATNWDLLNGAGGVVALWVDEVLTLNAPIDVSGAGFRGGTSDVTTANNCSFVTNANDYAYPFNDWRAAEKGEGIGLPLFNQESGRGALTIAGGGGNDHNAGGGGGANIGAGGQGGENNEPSFFGCNGNFPGRGGWPLASSDTRIFMGGGGGGGHENNNVGSDGGRGGGIVIIVANEIVGNNQDIWANGQMGPGSFGDGAGGGGAGGTIVVLADQLTGSLEFTCRWRRWRHRRQYQF